MNRTTKTLAALAGSTCLWFAANDTLKPALACGGLFCNAASPVNQTAERIFFKKNDDGTLTAAIEILYEGPSEKFAWVIPMPAGELDVGVSSKQAFDRVDAQTNPSYQLARTFEPCDNGVAGATGTSPSFSGVAGAATSAAGSSSATPVVTVVDSGAVGPYDFVRIAVDEESAEPVQAAVDWLTDNDYDVSALGVDKLRPYLDEGMTLLAFRLTKGNDVGSIRPVMLTYPADHPTIPIKPTAVAANDDMGVKVWVLGDSRAVPTTYLHLELNEAMINWFNPNATYNAVVTAAADEAGGQGFVTEFSGPAGNLASLVFSASDEARWDTVNQGQFATMADFLEAALVNFQGYDGLADVLADPEALPLREGATPEQFQACLRCYFEENVAVRTNAYPSTPYDPQTDPLTNMDPRLFLAKLEELVVEPLRATSQLFEDSGSVTRFYTTISPEDMVVDPDFDFDPNLPDVSNVHVAEQLFLCNATDADWRITLPQGMTVEGRGATWPISAESDMPVNLRVLQLSAGDGTEILEDNTSVVNTQLMALGVGNAQAALAQLDDSPANDDSTNDDTNDDSTNGETTDGDTADSDSVDDNTAKDEGAADGDTASDSADDTTAKDEGTSMRDASAATGTDDPQVSSNDTGSGCSLNAVPRPENSFPLVLFGGALALLRRRTSARRAL